MPVDFDLPHGDVAVTASRLRDLLNPNSGWEDIPATSRATAFYGVAVCPEKTWLPVETRWGRPFRTADGDGDTNWEIVFTWSEPRQ